jgi:hypothetical protein
MIVIVIRITVVTTMANVRVGTNSKKQKHANTKKLSRRNASAIQARERTCTKPMGLNLQTEMKKNAGL